MAARRFLQERTRGVDGAHCARHRVCDRVPEAEMIFNVRLKISTQALPNREPREFIGGADDAA